MHSASGLPSFVAAMCPWIIFVGLLAWVRLLRKHRLGDRDGAVEDYRLVMASELGCAGSQPGLPRRRRRSRSGSLRAGILRFAVAAIGMTFGASLRAQQENVAVIDLRPDPQTVVAKVPANFLGFGYETSAVAQRDFFSAKNAAMIQFYRTLSPCGLIRIGGNVSDHTRYEPDGVAVPHAQSAVTVLNKSNLADLGGFLRATGWQAMWGLNLGTGSKEQAVEEAIAVSAALGAQLQSFQIGNEVDSQPRFAGNYAAYHAAYLEYKAAIRAALPGAVFSGPDVASNLKWCAAFADTEQSDLSLLTYHYYRTGANKPEATLDTLLRSDDHWDRTLAGLQQICSQQSLRYRICETNSFYGGGKPGVSDAFGSALWCLDDLWLVASRGCSGINLQTDVNHLGWISHYSPIFRDAQDRYSARPEFYAMLAFSLVGNGGIVKLARAGGEEVNFSAYATVTDQGQLWVTSINKDQTRDVELKVALPVGWSSLELYPLRAPAVDSTEGVTFAAAAVTGEGRWTAGSLTRVAAQGGVCRVAVPHASATVIKFCR